MSLSWRDKSLIREQCASKLVDQICQGLIDGRELIPGLRESLGNSIKMVMEEPENKDKISTSIVESVKSSIPVQGPLLLYGLLQNNNTYEFTKSNIAIIFTRVYQKNDTAKLFNNRLFDQLSNPPFNTWFGQQTGGRKTKKSRKTKSKRKYTNKKKTRRKRNTTTRIMKQYGGMNKVSQGTEALSTATDAANNVSNAADKLSDAANNVSNAADNVSDANNNDSEEKNDNEGGDDAKEGDDDAKEGDDDAKEGDDDAKEGDDDAKEGDDDAKEETDEQSTTTSSQSGSSAVGNSGQAKYGVGSGPVPLSAGEINNEASSLTNKFNKELMNEVTKSIPDIKDQILTKMVNASYVHALKSGDVMLNSIIGSLNNSVQVNSNLINIFPIILVQAMVASFELIATTINRTHNEEKTETNEEKKDDVKFDPTLDPFLMNFMKNLKENIEEKINID